MTSLQRQQALTVLLAGLAGFGGVWVGARYLHPERTSAAPLRMAVDELARRGLGGLTREQKVKITDIEARFSRERAQHRARIASANSDLADALAEEMTLGPKVTLSIERLQGEIGELQRETVAYMLELRSVLTEQQRIVFDEKVMAALMATP